MPEREEVLSVLREYKRDYFEKYNIIAIGIFGSMARGEAGADSDVDICVKTKTPDPYSLVHIREDIENRLRVPVDIIRIREKMNPDLRQRIERDAIYV